VQTDTLIATIKILKEYVEVGIECIDKGAKNPRGSYKKVISHKVTITMEKIRSYPLSSLLPWLAPLVIKFAILNGGIEVQLYRKNQLLKNWHASMLLHFLPEPLVKWIDEHHIALGPQPYPLIKQLWQYLLPLASKKLIIDPTALTELEEISQPQGFALIWRINRSLMCIEGGYEGADRYLGMGWFQKGTKIWSLKYHPSNAIDMQLRNLIMPVQHAKFLLSSIMPDLQQYLPIGIDFQLISDFAVRVIVLDAQIGRVTLALQCNYPQFLPTIQVRQQQVDVLLANQAIIGFPHQALTPVLIQLLQNSAPITIQGAGVPLFISEQLPVMRHFYQISDDMAAKITQSNPIVPIATLKPTLSFVQIYENGIGKYIITASYQYQQHTLDMSAFITARWNNQRFVQQHPVWFEWPYDSRDLVSIIQQQQKIQVLRPEEVMGFDTRRTALLYKQLIIHTMLPGETTPIERSKSIFKQLRYHGIPGGIVGDPKEMVTMFVNACEYVLRDNRQAHILWLVPSNKKGSVTRAVHDTTISSYVLVASLVTLRDEPTLLSRSWTLVIFQGLDILLDVSPQSSMLSQLKWQWALTSVTSVCTLGPSIMRILHLPDQYYEQFCARYLFDLERSPKSAVTSQSVSGPNTAQPTSPNVPKKDEMLRPPVSLAPAFIQTAPSIVPKKEEILTSAILLPPASTRPASDAINVISEKSSPLNTPIKSALSQFVSSSAPSPISHSIELNQKKIARLHEESEQLQERLSVEDEEGQAQLSIIPIPDPVLAAKVIREIVGPAPEVDEDWQIILQHWQPEHWEVINMLYQGHSAQLTTVGHKAHRPVSQLIDEINSPVDEHLGDLLVDPETHALSPHLRAIAENLIRWYFSSKDR
jgi:hypothetical protein